MRGDGLAEVRCSKQAFALLSNAAPQLLAHIHALFRDPGLQAHEHETSFCVLAQVALSISKDLRIGPPFTERQCDHGFHVLVAADQVMLATGGALCRHGLAHRAQVPERQRGFRWVMLPEGHPEPCLHLRGRRPQAGRRLLAVGACLLL